MHGKVLRNEADERRLRVSEHTVKLGPCEVQRHGEDQETHHDAKSQPDRRAEVERGSIDGFHETSARMQKTCYALAGLRPSMQ